MSIVDAIQSKGAEEEIRDAVSQAVEGEEKGLKWEQGGAKQNTHFEMKFGESREEEVFVYIERLDSDKGIELMVWADEAYFRGVDEDYPDIEDGGEELAEFVDVVGEYVLDELDGEHSVSVSFSMNASPSVVFTDQFYIE